MGKSYLGCHFIARHKLFYVEFRGLFHIFSLQVFHIRPIQTFSLHVWTSNIRSNILLDFHAFLIIIYEWRRSNHFFISLSLLSNDTSWTLSSRRSATFLSFFFLSRMLFSASIFLSYQGRLLKKQTTKVKLCKARACSSSQLLSGPRGAGKKWINSCAWVCVKHIKGGVVFVLSVCTYLTILCKMSAHISQTLHFSFGIWNVFLKEELNRKKEASRVSVFFYCRRQTCLQIWPP